MLCEVYLFDAPYHIDRAFDYSFEGNLSVGSIVRVPFGKSNGIRLGVVTKIKDELSEIETKPVQKVLTDRSFFTEELLGLCLFLKEYTLCTFGEAARCILPPGALSEKLNVKYRKRYILNTDKEGAQKLLGAKGKEGIRSEGQRAVISYLSDIGSADAELLRELAGVSPAHISALVSKGILSVSEEEEYRNPYSEYAKKRDMSPIMLSRAQSSAYEKIIDLYREDAAKAALLYGVTGSGKTKVIMKVIDSAIADGKSAIMMVPEIALTPQTVGIFCKRYGERVAVIHSSLSAGERLDAYRRIKNGKVDLVIGTRSAVFAPLNNLGLIVIDEEHEHTYKSESDPKYHTKDVAAYRCGKNKALMLLASATPSVESFYKAKEGKYTLVELRERYGGVHLPDAVIVDMREELRLGNTSPISDRLLKSLAEAKECDNQSILFLNRRGYNSQINCKSCGEVITCPRCSVSLTYHTGKDGGKMLCHLCGHTEPVPKVCPSCSSDNLSFLGYGTQKVEGSLGEFLPECRVMRMDADTTSGKLSYDRMLEDFREGRADILLGTQMVAKGHDFPKVKLVGVILADTSLYVSDFRASERTFSLLTQVIGRAGRASGRGVAVIQTYSPQNEIIRLACEQNYDKFYEGEISIRKELSYPPFCDMVSMSLTSEREQELFSAAKRLSDSVINKLKDGEYSTLPFVVFGPFEAQVYKVNEKYRMKMVLKCRVNSKSRAFFREILCEFSNLKNISLAIDINPLNI